MRSSNQIQVVSTQKLVDHIFAKHIRHSAFIAIPSFDIRRWIAPQQIAEQSALWDIRRSLNMFHRLNVFELWRQSAVHTENLLLDECTNRQKIEHIAHDTPQLDTEAPLAFVVETIRAIDACFFMVTAQQKKIQRILVLVGKQQRNGLNREFTAVDIVAEKEIVDLTVGRRETNVLKNAQQIKVLPVNVAHDFEWPFQLQQDWLLLENLATAITKRVQFFLAQTHRYLPRFFILIIAAAAAAFAAAMFEYALLLQQRRFGARQLVEVDVLCDPRVLHDLVDGEALLVVDAHQLAHQVLGGVADMVPVRRWEFVLAADDHAVHGVDRVRVERLIPAEHDVQDHAQRPEVDLVRVLVGGEHLGRHVVRRATARVHHMQRGRQLEVVRQAKVGDLEHAVRGEQDILRLQVAMHHKMLMQVLQ
mmetsp:Transcript_16620/g.25685  ORF Transcript_16620/g.25685 Transcript_16620/m.25685 type:complete len:419 (-) Transcript_16620:343-1599(-)